MKTWELMEKGCTVEALVKHELWLHEQESRLLFTHPPSFPCRGLVVIIDISVSLGVHGRVTRDAGRSSVHNKHR